MATGERASADHDGSLAQTFLFARQSAAYDIAVRHLTAADRVIDLACGTGYGTSRVSDVVADATGVDVSATAVARCQLTYGSPICRFAVADGTQLPFSAGEFTAGVSFQTIEHVRDDAAFVRELRRVIQRGGLCLLTTPNRIARLRPGQRPWNRFHIREYDAADLQRLLTAEFSQVAIQGLHTSERWMEFERDRIASAQRIARMDPWNLRHRVPIGLVSAVRKLFSPRGVVHGERSGANSMAAIGSDEFFLSDETSTALDLFAVCQ